MKALFVGDYNRYTVSLMAKLSKNGVSLAVVNNNPKRKDANIHHTKYTINKRYALRVFENFRPDVVLVTATYDDEDYLDDLKEILTQAVVHKLKRLIFLSSTAVYGIQPAGGMLPAENDSMQPVSRQGLMFAAGEDLCRRWEKSSGMEVTILRLSGIYGKGAEGDVVDMMLESLLKGERVALPQQAGFAPLHVDDMAEAVMQVVESGFSPTYNLSSSTILSAIELQGKLQRLLPLLRQMFKRDISGKTELEEDRTVDCYAGDTSLFRSEYQWREKHAFDRELSDLAIDTWDRIQREAKKEAARNRKEERTASGRVNWLGYAETVLLFVVAALLTRIQASVPLIGEVDFVVLYLVLIAVTMSLEQSALALIMACGLLALQQAQTGYDVFTAILNHNTLLKAAEYSIVGITVSYVIHRMKTHLQFARLELNDQKSEMSVMEQFSKDNLTSRHFFEDQILEYEVSLPRVIAMTARLDTLEPERILPETIGILSGTIGVDDVAAYVVGSRGGRMRLSFAKTGGAISMGQSPLIDDYSDMMNDLENDRVYINRSLDSHYPSMATGVKMNDKLSIVFVIWNIPFGKMRLDTSNLLQAITRLVSAALRRAYQYEELTRHERYVEDTNVLKADAFRRQLQARPDFNGLIKGVMSRITGEGNLKQQSEKLSALIRENDFMGLDDDGNLVVLLSGTGLEGHRVFETRLAKVGLSGVLVEEK